MGREDSDLVREYWRVWGGKTRVWEGRLEMWREGWRSGFVQGS